MRDALFGDKIYSYLGENAKERMDLARKVAENARIKEHSVIYLGGVSYVFFPWLGTRSFRTVRRFMQKNAKELGISDIESEGCYYITFKSNNDAKDILYRMRAIVERDGLDTHALVFPGECPLFDKYDEYIPPELLREAYAEDRLLADEILTRLWNTDAGCEVL